MRIGFLMLRHPRNRVSPIMPEVVRLLEEWGVEVTLMYPEEELTSLSDLIVDHDLYVLKSGTDVALSYAATLHALGASIVNPYPVTAMCRNKIVATRLLQQAGVPVPDSFIASGPAQLAPLLDIGPLVVKPHHGSHGHAAHVVWDADELHDVGSGTGPLFVQRYHQPDGPDRKLYCIGGQVFGVTRVWPVRSYHDKLGEPFTVTPELRRIVARCGQAFGLDLFGVDIIVSGGRPLVVDIAPFPGFKGVPDGALRLADYIFGVVDHQRRTVAPMLAVP